MRGLGSIWGDLGRNAGFCLMPGLAATEWLLRDGASRARRFHAKREATVQKRMAAASDAEQL